MAEAAYKDSRVVYVCPFCEIKLTDHYILQAHIDQFHDPSRVDTNEEWFDVTAYVNTEENYQGLFLCDKLKTLKGLLKRNFQKYLETFKLWILCEISKVEFDQEVREFFTPETIRIHHEFLIDFMKEIRAINKGTEATSLNTNVSGKGETSQDEEAWSSCKEPENADPLYISLKRSLPDFETIYGLVTLNAWENEQPSVHWAAFHLIHNVAEAIVRNILRTILLRRKHLSETSNETISNENDPNKNYRNTDPKPADVVTLEELLDCLVAHPKLIPIKSVYNFTVRRILNGIKNNTDASAETEKDS